jgi:hypothetical protein
VTFGNGCPGAQFSGDLRLDRDKSEDLHDEIVHLEERIEGLAAKIESCRKLILVSRIAVAGGVVVLATMLFGAIRFDPGIMAAAVAALLGGIVVWGSNRSTRTEAARDLAAAEADRSALIDKMDLSVLPASPSHAPVGQARFLTDD